MNQGGVCPRGQAGLEVLYNPDRIKAPLKRTSERGARGWQNISWDEAVESVVGNLKKLQDSGQEDGLMLLANGTSGPLDQLLTRFAHSSGIPHYFKNGLNCPAQVHYHLMHGNEQEFAYDLEQTNYILSFGSHFLESEPALGWYSRMFGYIRRERQGSRATIVQIDPQLSITGIKADEWIAIKPGSYGALALGIAHLLIREQQYNEEFITKNTFGFNDWQDRDGKNHIGFKTLVLRDYLPRVVAQITGVQPRTLVRLASEFATNNPVLALVKIPTAFINTSQMARQIVAIQY